MCQKSEYFLYQMYKMIYPFIVTGMLGIWKWITDYILILLSVSRFIHLHAIFRSKAGFSALYWLVSCSYGKEDVEILELQDKVPVGDSLQGQPLLKEEFQSGPIASML